VRLTKKLSLSDAFDEPTKLGGATEWKNALKIGAGGKLKIS
jgi:hypothetical protein